MCIGCNVDGYNGHSFRIGTAINATSVHVEDISLKFWVVGPLMFIVDILELQLAQRFLVSHSLE